MTRYAMGATAPRRSTRSCLQIQKPGDAILKRGAAVQTKHIVCLCPKQPRSREDCEAQSAARGYNISEIASEGSSLGALNIMRFGTGKGTMNSGGSCTAAFNRRYALTTFLASLCALDNPAAPAAAIVPVGVTPMGVAEAELPAGVRMMRAQEQAQMQAQMIQRSAAMTNEERFDQGLAMGRGQAAKSIDVLLRNEALATLPGCSKPAATLRDAARAISKADGPLTPKELTRLASTYELAAFQIETALTALPEAQRRDAQRVAARMRAADDEVKQPFFEGGRFASGVMGSSTGAALDDETKREREAYLSGTMDAARAALRDQRLEKATGKAERALYGRSGPR